MKDKRPKSVTQILLEGLDRYEAKYGHILKPKPDEKPDRPKLKEDSQEN